MIVTKTCYTTRPMRQSLTQSPVQPSAGPWLRLSLSLGLLGIFWLRLQALTHQPIWWDEARNLDVAMRPFWQIAGAPELDIQPPLYYWLLHGWLGSAGLAPGADPVQLAFVARLMSVGVCLLGCTLLYRLGRQLFAPWVGVIGLLIAGLSPFWQAESQETRMYTLGFALLTAAALALMRLIAIETATDVGTIKSRQRWSAGLSFVFLSTAALLTHYNALFILVAWYGWWGICALLRPDRWRQLRTLFACGLAMVVLLLPIIPIALRQIPTYANPNLVVPTIADYLRQNWQAYWGGYAFDPAFLGGYGMWWLGAALVFFVTGLAAFLWSGRAAVLAHPVAFLLVWAIGGLALYYLAVLDRGAFNVRYSSFITPALYLLMAVALYAWIKRWRLLGLIMLVALLIGFAPALRADLLDARFAREDIIGVTAWLRQQAGPEDLILVDQKYPFGFYYDRFAIEPEVQPTGNEAAPARYLFVDINTLDQRLNEWASDARQVFWVQWFESDTDPRHAVPFLLDQAGQLAGSQSFQGYVIDWWVLDPPNRFTLGDEWQPLQLRFPPAAETIAVSLPTTSIAPGKSLPVVIRWQRGPSDIPPRPYKARVALYNDEDARLVQSDERLLNDRHVMPAYWETNDQPLNVYGLALPADLPAGSYQVRLLVYDGETLEPLSVLDEAGNPAGIEPSLGSVMVGE